MRIAFFGHSDAPESIRPKIKQKIEELILYNQADTFYVGNQGSFDAMTTGVLSELRNTYSHIKCFTVLAYRPKQDELFSLETIFPEKVDLAQKKFAIAKRNDWLIENCDIVISYITHIGGAEKFAEKAKKKNKLVINLSDYK